MTDNKDSIWRDRPRQTGGGALRFFATGQGPTLVLLHGVGLRAEAWCGMLDELSPHYRIICPDLPGHGQSPRKGEADLASFTLRLADFISELPGTVCLGGHSMGALLAVELAAFLPDKVAALVGLNAVYRRTPEAARAVRDRAAALAVGEAVDPHPTLNRWFGAEPTGARADCAAACGRWLSSGDVAGYAAAYTVFAHQDGPADATLDKVACPSLFLTAADDPNSTPDMSRALALRTKGTAQMIEDAAHMVPMTHGATVAAHLHNHFRQSVQTR